VLVNAIVVMATPEHFAWLEGVATAMGVGFTTIVAVIGVPMQVLAVGVIVNVTVSGAAVELVKEPLISPLPLVAIPVTDALSLVQAKVVPGTLPVKTILVMALAEHIDWLEGVAIASGVGLTVMVAVPGIVLEQAGPLWYATLTRL
jgi:hypothetical protein